jgi:hypothetical protein
MVFAGMTLDALDADLVRCFAAGMAYTALSRCRSLAGLRIVSFGMSSVQASPAAKDFMTFASARADGWRSVMQGIAKLNQPMLQKAPEIDSEDEFES